MTANPLVNSSAQGRGYVTLDMLERKAAELNAKRWTGGKLWFVGRRKDENGEVTHFLDRAA